MIRRPMITETAIFSIMAAALSLAASAQPLPHRVTAGWADLRNEVVLAATEPDYVQGRRLLEAAAAAHGLKAWRQHRTFEVVATDTWVDPSPWWPKQEQRVRLLQQLGTFTSRAVLLEGTTASGGSAVGLQAWTPYEVDSAGVAAPSAEPNGTASFYLPTLHYFNELPFRLLTAPVSIAAGEATLNGTHYDRVFVTWGEGDPSGEFDQYVLWINRETRLIEKANYTVRESEQYAPPEQKEMMRAAAVGTIHYLDYRDVAGVQFAFRHVVTLFGPEQAKLPLEEHYFHMLEIEQARFDSVEPGELMPLQGLPEPGDRKTR